MTKKFIKSIFTFFFISLFFQNNISQNLWATPYSSNIINLSYSGKDTIAFIIKDQSLLKIVEVDSQKISEIGEYILMPLSNLDNKNMENDNSTPEGIYFVSETIELKDFSNPAKPVALVLNFPNDADLYNKRTGSNVWIQNQTGEKNENNSCFYLKNNDLSKLKKFIKPNSTAIIILKSMNHLNQTSISDWKILLDKWMDSFSSKLLINHFGMYVTDSDEINFDYAKKINKIITENNTNYDLNIKDVIILTTPHESIASFKFNFKSEEYSLNKQFSLSLLPIENELKIFSENANYKPKSISSSDKELKDFIFRWKDSWEKKDFKSYIAFYSTSFTDEKRNYRQFYNYKKVSFKSIQEIKILIKNLEIFQLENNQWKVTFIQDYWTERYQDKGLKTIFIQKNETGFLIIKEMWQEISD